MNRKGESGNVPIRVDRFFAVNSSWYFSTREAHSIGPYESKLEAIDGLRDYITFMNTADSAVLNSFLSTLRN